MPPIINDSLLDERMALLEKARPWSARVTSKLEMHIRTADDYALFRINPLKFAADKNITSPEAIDLFLHASKLLLFEMDWHLVCPTCGTVVESFKELGGLHSHFLCPLCSRAGEADLDEYIQVAFTVSPQIRDVLYHHRERLMAELPIDDYFFKYHLSNNVLDFSEGQSYRDIITRCTKGSGFLAPGTTLHTEFDAPPGMLFARNLHHHTGVTLAVGAQAQAQPQKLPMQIVAGRLEPVDQHLPTVDVNMGGIERHLEQLGTADQGTLAVDITNRSDQTCPIWLIHFPATLAPHEQQFAPFLSGKRLLSTQSFLDLFRSITTPAAEGMAVRDLTYLFTDLKGSTALYDAIGDPQAFYLVRQHFATLMHAVARNNGAIVKTIGDAVMATFLTPLDAVRAALDMRTGIAEFNAGISQKLVLKIGIHKGHSIAVTLNDRLDYFGQSVNLASRIQNLAGADDIYLSANVFNGEAVASALAPFTVTAEQALMKGISSEVAVYKIAA